MTDEVKNIPESKNEGSARGVLLEKKWEITDDKLKDGTPCKLLKGNISLGTDSGTMDFGFYQQNMFMKEHKENFRYKTILDALNGYNSKAEGGEATMVSVNYSARRSKPTMNKRGNVVDYTNFDIKKIGTFIEDDDHPLTVEGVLTGILMSKVPEMIGDTETGRLKITVGTITYSQNYEPYDMFIEKDIADEFDNLYEIGDVGRFDYEIKTVHRGAKKVVTTSGLGRTANVESGFDVTEWVLIGCSEPFEEDMEDYFTMEDVEPLVENRNIEFENAEKSEKTSSKKSKSGLKEKTVSVVDEGDMPF